MDARVLVEVEEESEEATKEPTNSLPFVNAKNQFKWNGSVELFESFLHQKLGLLADDVTKSSNGTCTVWKTPSVTFNLYAKTKTLLVQGKAMDYTRDLLLQTIQAVNNQNSAESPDGTNNINCTIDHTTGGAHQQAGIMSPTATADTRNYHSLVREDSEAALGENASDSESESESSERAELAHNTSEGLINNLGEKISKEIAKIWPEIGHIKSGLANSDRLLSLQQELDELRLKCIKYECTIDHLDKEKASLLEVIKILSSDNNRNRQPIPSTAVAVKQAILLLKKTNGPRSLSRRKRKRSQKLAIQMHVNKIFPTPVHKNLGVTHQILCIPTRTQILPRDRNHQ